jgi:hypothetical protein
MYLSYREASQLLRVFFEPTEQHSIANNATNFSFFLSLLLEGCLILLAFGDPGGTSLADLRLQRSV